MMEIYLNKNCAITLINGQCLPNIFVWILALFLGQSGANVKCVYQASSENLGVNYIYIFEYGKYGLK